MAGAATTHFKILHTSKQTTANAPQPSVDKLNACGKAALRTNTRICMAQRILHYSSRTTQSLLSASRVHRRAARALHNQESVFEKLILASTTSQILRVQVI